MAVRLPLLRASAACLAVTLALAATLALGACQARSQGPGGGSERSTLEATPRPARRGSGPRLAPPFGGQDPASLGLVRVEGLLWLSASDATSWPAGGAGVRADPAAGPGAGLSLRSDHVLLTTDLAAAQALPLVRLAQQHVEALLAAYSEVLDLRLPLEPLPVRVYARRADFAAVLAARVGEAEGWNAYYDVEDGLVRVAAEPAAQAPLPLSADLKHELTHAVIDLSAPRPVPHARIVGGLHFWLWEGIAVHAEGLGEAGAGAAYAVREARFRSRLAHREVPSVADYLVLPQERFTGQHYDMTAVWMRFLLADPQLGPRTLDLLRRLIAGDLTRHDPERECGLPVSELERRWRLFLGRGG